MLSGEEIGMEAGEPVTMALVTGKMAKAGLVGIEIKHDTGGGPDWMWGNAEREKRVKWCWVSSQDSDEWLTNLGTRSFLGCPWDLK